MILFGLLIDRFGRRVGVIATTVFLVFVRPTPIASPPKHQLITRLGYRPRNSFAWYVCHRHVLDDDHFSRHSWSRSWWRICRLHSSSSRICRHLCFTSKEARFPRDYFYHLAIISGFVASSIVSLVVLAIYGGKASDGVWRICFCIGIIVSFDLSGILFRRLIVA